MGVETELIGMGLLFLPGIIFSLRMNPGSIREWITYALLFSLLITGSVLYVGSSIVGLSPLFVIVYLLATIVFMGVKRGELKRGLQSISHVPEKKDSSSVFLVMGLLVIVGLAGLLAYGHVDQQYDTLAYHLPFIQDFTTEGHDHFYPAPQNNYEIRSNLYPKIMESLVGGIQITSPLVARGIPLLFFVLSLLLVYELARRIQPGKGPLFAAAFWASSTLVILQSFSFYVDILTSIWVVALALFFVREHNHPSSTHWWVIGALGGALIATKITALIILPAVALVIGVYFRPAAWKNKMGLVIGLLGGGGYYLFIAASRYLILPVSPFQLAAGNVDPIGENIIGQLVHNTQGFFFILVLFGLMGYFCWLVFPTYIHSLFRIRTRDEKIVHVLAGSIFVLFFLFSVATTGNVRSDTFPRFILPWLALAAVMGGVALDRWVQSIPKPSIRRTAGIAVVGIIVAGLIVTAYWEYNYHTQLEEVEQAHQGTWEGLKDQIANDANMHLYYANTPNGIHYGLDRVEIFDYTSFPNPTLPACAFLESKGINRLVIFNYLDPRPEYGVFNQALMREATTGKCGTLLSQTGAWMVIYSLP